MLHLIRRFLQSEHGVTAPIIALAMTSLVAATGASIDYARAQMVQTKLADTLDAAGLAAGATLSSQDSSKVAQNYFTVNFPAGYLGATPTPVQVALDQTQTVLSLSATASVPTIFMGMMGVNTMDVSASTEITRQSGGLELTLVMDNTGSMAGTKLANLKTAAIDLVNILFGKDETKEKLWIGLVPFSQSVNIGTDKLNMNWINKTAYNKLNWGNTSWMGCIDERSSGLDQTDDKPTTNQFDAYYWKDDANNDWITSKGVAHATGTTLGPNKYCSQRILELTNKKTDIINAINSMAAAGNTHVNVGAVWGWRMLSPNWRGIWGSTMGANSLPLDYGIPHMTKAVIMLTDGENTMDSTTRTSYGYLSEGRLGTTNASKAVTALNTRLTNVCTSMKSHGIKVYTILFDLSSTTIGTLFKNCATQPDFYFNSPTSTELHQAFRTIGDSLSNLRISK